MTTRPSRRFRLSQHRWCWCGRPAALVVERSRTQEFVEDVCSADHGAQAIEWLEEEEDS